MTDQPRDEPDAAMSTPVASWPSYRCGNPDPHPAHRGMAGPSLCRGNPAADGDGQATATNACRTCGNDKGTNFVTCKSCARAEVPRYLPDADGTTPGTFDRTETAPTTATAQVNSPTTGDTPADGGVDSSGDGELAVPASDEPADFERRIRFQLVQRGVPEDHADWYLKGFRANVLREAEAAATPDGGSLRERIAAALRAAAHSCDGTCGLDERTCHEAHPVQEAATTHGVISDLYGPIDAIAEVVAGVREDEMRQLRERVALLERGAAEREALLTEARDALEAAGQPGAHADDWPAVAPGIRALAARAVQAEAALAEVRERHARASDGTCEECITFASERHTAYATWPCPTIRDIDGKEPTA